MPLDFTGTIPGQSVYKASGRSMLPQARPVQTSSTQSLDRLSKLSALQFSGKPGPSGYVYNPKNNLVNIIRTRAEQNPNGISLTIPKHFAVGDAKGANNISITNLSLYDGALQTAKVLQKQYNIKPGDRIATIEASTPEYIQMLLASMMLGATIVPINLQVLAEHTGKIEKLVHMLKASECKVLFEGKVVDQIPQLKELKKLKKLAPLVKLRPVRWIAGGALRSVRALAYLLPKPTYTGKQPFFKAVSQTIATLKDNERMGGIQTMLKDLPGGMKVALPEDYEAAASKVQPLSATEKASFEKDLDQRLEGDREALMLFTSGTTSNPKGVMHTHESITHTIEAIQNTLKGDITPQDKMLMTLPMYHIFGLAAFMGSLGMGVQTLVVPSTAEAIMRPKKLLATIQEEGVTAWPLVPIMLELALRQPDAAEKLKSLRIAVSGAQKLPEKLFNRFFEVHPEGQLWEGYGMTEIGIVSVNKAKKHGNVGKVTSPHVQIQVQNPDAKGIGEIWVRTASLGKPYIGADKAQIEEAFKPEQWFSTGDVGFVDSDKDLTICGRSRERFKIEGEMFSPDDFDQRLTKFLPIKDSITFAYQPGTENERVVSIVLLNKDASGETEASLKQKLSARAAAGETTRKYIPPFILPLTQDSFPPEIMPPTGKKIYNGARAYLSRLIAEGTVELTTGAKGKDEKLVIKNAEKLKA